MFHIVNIAALLMFTMCCKLDSTVWVIKGHHKCCDESCCLITSRDVMCIDLTHPTLMMTDLCGVGMRLPAVYFHKKILSYHYKDSHYRNEIIPWVWIVKTIQSKVWDEITNPFPNLNVATVEVWELISNFIPHFTAFVITYPCWD